MALADDLAVEVVVIGGSLLRKQVSDVHMYKCVVLLHMFAKYLLIDKGGFVLTLGGMLALHLKVR